MMLVGAHFVSVLLVYRMYFTGLNASQISNLQKIKFLELNQRYYNGDTDGSLQC